ncbi:MAG TPA: SRPBCC domain-containing protein [Limnochordia bacterium]
MEKGFIAKASIVIDAPSAKVWHALVDPEAIKQYMFGTNVVSDWKEGSSIVWRGEWQGTSYEDKGTILQMTPGRMLRYTHYSPLSGMPDHPDSYHTITIELSEEGARTRVSLSQDNNRTEDARRHSEENWKMMLAALKRFVEA